MTDMASGNLPARPVVYPPGSTRDRVGGAGERTSLELQRLLIVANRLPVTVTAEPGGARLSPSSGGLATGLGPWHRRGTGAWIGWPGETHAFAPEARDGLDGQLAALSWPRHFFPSASRSRSACMLRSANMRFSRRFSSSSVFSFCASDTLMPLYFAFHR